MGLRRVAITHDAEGYSVNAVEKNREKARRWRRNNLERARAYERTYQYALYQLRDRHRDEFLAILKEARRVR